MRPIGRRPPQNAPKRVVPKKSIDNDTLFMHSYRMNNNGVKKTTLSTHVTLIAGHSFRGRVEAVADVETVEVDPIFRTGV